MTSNLDNRHQPPTGERFSIRFHERNGRGQQMIKHLECITQAVREKLLLGMFHVEKKETEEEFGPCSRSKKLLKDGPKQSGEV